MIRVSDADRQQRDASTANRCAELVSGLLAATCGARCDFAAARLQKLPALRWLATTSNGRAPLTR
jgi:hypothetical protein